MRSEIYIEINDGEIEGSVPVGTVLRDGLARSGVSVSGGCDIASGSHLCHVLVEYGIDTLSPISDIETKYLVDKELADGYRLACEAVFIKPGDCKIVTKDPTNISENADQDIEISVVDRLVKEFSELPLGDKAAALVKMEASALGQTIEFVMNSPYDVFGKIGDVLADIGMKKDKETEAAKRPSSETARDASATASDTEQPQK